VKIFFLVVVMSGWTISGAADGYSLQPLNRTATLQQANFTNKPWRLKTFSVSPAIDWDLDGKVETDILSKLEDCERDDLLIFRKDGIVFKDTGKKLCEDEDAGKREDGTWTYDAAGKRLILKQYDKSQVCKIVESSANRLVLTYQWKTPKGKLHEITAVYIL